MRPKDDRGLLSASPPPERTVDVARGRRKRLVEAIAPLVVGAPGICIYTHDLARGRLRQISGDVAQWVGLPTTFSVDAYFALVHPLDRDGVVHELAALREHLGDDDVITQTYRLRSPAGEYRWFNIRSRVFARNPDGSPRRMIGMACDISQLHMPSIVLAQAQEALGHAEETERRRIGRELHDMTGQHLAAAQLSLAALKNRNDPDMSAARQLTVVRESIEAAQHQIRTLSFLMHATQPSQVGFSEAMRAISIGFGRRADLAVKCVEQGAPRAVGGPVENALFNVLKEALLNAYRHAEAREILVTLAFEPAAVRLEVSDDGRVGASGAEQEFAPDGVGISSMRARLAEVGGELAAGPTATGFRVFARAPFPSVSPCATNPQRAQAS